MVEAAVAPCKKRRVWDPEKTDLVEQVFAGLVERYRSGDLREEIRPMTLLDDEGGDCAAFYKAAFLGTAAWSSKRFPAGWDSFVEELRARLEGLGISVVDTKREVQGSAWIPDRERGLIRGVVQAYKEGSLPKADAIRLLKEEFGFSLSDGKLRYYFDEVKVTPPSVEENKERLVARIEKLKLDNSIDLSISACIQGHVFEKFVGVVLRSIYPNERLTAQKCLVLPYRDFAHKNHYYIYLDWSGERDTFEVKYRNTVENMLESAVPQAVALGHKQTIVYRHPCQEMLYKIEANLRMDGTLNELGLLNEKTKGKRIKDFINYIPVEALLSCSPEAELLRKTLEVLDERLPTAEPKTLWEWADALDRIAAATEQLSERLDVFAQGVLEGRRFTGAEITRLFGRPQKTEAAGEEDIKRRIGIIMRERSSARDRLLLAVYNKALGKQDRVLEDAHVLALVSLPEKTFLDAALSALEEMAARKQERELRARRVDPVEVMHKTISVFEKTERQRLADRHCDADELDDRCNAALERAMNQVDQYLNQNDEVVRRGAVSDDRLVELVKKTNAGRRAKLDMLAFDQVKFLATGFSGRHEALMLRFCRTVCEELKAAGERADRGWNVDPDTSQLSHIVSELRAAVENNRKSLAAHPFVEACRGVGQESRAGRLTLSSREAASLNLLYRQMDFAPDRIAVNIADTMVKLIDYHSACFPGEGLSMLQHIAMSLGPRKNDPFDVYRGMLMAAFEGNRRFLHSAFVGLKREGEYLEAVKRGTPIISLLIPELSKLVMARETKQGSLLVHDPNRSETYIRRAAALWTDEQIKSALEEAERYLWRHRAVSWESALLVMTAAARGASIDVPPVPADDSAVIEVPGSCLRPIAPAEIPSTAYPVLSAVLEKTMIPQHLLSCDLWSRRIAQARRIACIDGELAHCFLVDQLERCPAFDLPFDRFTFDCLRLCAASDADYEGLVG